MKRLLMLFGALVALVIAVAAGYLIARHTTPSASTPSAAQRKVLYWYDPMTPGQHFAAPGPSPTMPTMPLKPKYADEAGGGDDGVRISPRIEENLGLRTARVTVAALHAELRVPGVLAWDQRRSVVVSARTDGVLSQLFVRAPFDRVRAGQPLAELLAPAWGAAAAEYGALAGAQSADGRALRAAALQRLHVLGMNSEQIHRPAAGDGIVLRAPADGVISVLDVRAGQQVAAGTTLMRIDDPARLWLDAAIPQAEVAGIGAGTPAQIEISALPGRLFPGRVEALLPEVDARTRTQTARIAVDNPDGTLAPGMFAAVRLTAAAGQPHPLVPDEALISTGLQNRVVLDLGDGRMAPRAVRIGRSAGGYTEVLAGLKGGERVVTSGQFLLDSEANLDGALQRLTTPPAPAKQAVPRKQDPAGAGPSSPTLLPPGEGSQAPTRTRMQPSAHDAMPGMAMPASAGGKTP